MRDDIDAQLAAVFQDVPVPAGLAGRLLDRLAADSARVASRSRRRWLLVASGLLAAAASLVIAVSLRTHGEKFLSEQIVLDEAVQSFEGGVKDTGRLLSETPAPPQYPLSRMVRHTGAARWRPLDGFLGGRGAVYDLAGPAGPRASLYVVAREVKGLRTTPTLHPFTSAGSSCCASAWQEDGLLYVLVVQGDRATYESYLKLPRSPVALTLRLAVRGSRFLA